MHTYIHTYIHTHINTYIHTCTNTPLSSYYVFDDGQAGARTYRDIPANTATELQRPKAKPADVSNETLAFAILLAGAKMIGNFQ